MLLIYIFNSTKDNSWVIDIAQKVSDIIETYDDGDVVFAHRVRYLKRIKIILDDNLEILVKRNTGEKIIESSKCHKTFGDLREKLSYIYKLKHIDEKIFIKMMQKIEAKLKEVVYV
jgi:hypothetical protein